MITTSDRLLTGLDSHRRSFDELGAHLVDGGARFAYQAPEAASVSVIGDFNHWTPGAHAMQQGSEGGVWEAIVPGVSNGALYQYHVHSGTLRGAVPDPYAFCCEPLPGTASRVWDLDSYQWQDAEWMRGRPSDLSSLPVSIYEVHAGSWMRVPQEGNRWLTWRELASKLADYIGAMGYTHVEFLPVAEHLDDASWGYQVSSPFAPTSRFGSPSDFMFLVDHLHQRGIGVVLDGLAHGEFWRQKYHIDGLRNGGEAIGVRWNLTWTRNTLAYISNDPLYRSYRHDQLLSSVASAVGQDCLLPLSHDEVVHGQGSILARMPGDEWQKFANLRLLYGYMFGCPGKKMLFMGDDFGQWGEWKYDRSLDWHLLDGNPRHRQLQRWVRDLNTFLRGAPALYLLDSDAAGFEWVDDRDEVRSVFSFLRKSRREQETLLFICNFTPVPRYNYRAGVPLGGFWKEVLNSDAALYGGSGQGNMGGVEASPLPIQGRPWSLSITAPPLGVVVFRQERS